MNSTRLNELIGQYGFQCSETKELAPTMELAEGLKWVAQLETDLAAAQREIEELRKNQDYRWPEGVGWDGVSNACELLKKKEAEIKELKIKAQEEYERGLTAGKLEAASYTPEERERYGKWAAQADNFHHLKAEIERLKAERDRFRRALEEIRELPCYAGHGSDYYGEVHGLIEAALAGAGETEKDDR